MDENKKQLVLDYQEIFGIDAGKRVLGDLAARFYKIRIIPMGMPDATAFELGKREAYLYILNKIEADPNEVQQEGTEMEDFNAGG